MEQRYVCLYIIFSISVFSTLRASVAVCALEAGVAVADATFETGNAINILNAAPARYVTFVIYY